MFLFCVRDVDTCIVVKAPSSNTGKTTFVKRHLTGDFEKKYERTCLIQLPSGSDTKLSERLSVAATIGVEVHPLDFTTNLGKIRFYCWDTAGQERYRSMTPLYYRFTRNTFNYF